MDNNTQRFMNKRWYKTLYRTKKFGKFVLSELTESFLYLLYISTPPLMAKVFGMCAPDYRQTAINAQMGRLYKKGYISKIKRGRNIFVSLVGDFWKLKGDFITTKRKKYQRGWDRKWRIIIYDIPETKKDKRNRLRELIKQLGFGKVQGSCWISCYDFSDEIYAFAKEERILDYLGIHEGRFYTGKSIDILVEEIWNLKDLHKEYAEFIRKCNERVEFIKTEERQISDYYRLYHESYCGYQEILTRDPYLPDEFLRQQLRPKAEAVFNKLTSLVAKELLKNI